MKITPLEHTLLALLECLGALTVTVLVIGLLTLFIVIIEDLIKQKHNLF